MWKPFKNPNSQPGFATTRNPQASMMETIAPLGKFMDNLPPAGPTYGDLWRAQQRIGTTNPAEIPMHANQRPARRSIFDRFSDIWNR